jgi:hypothetical protein
VRRDSVQIGRGILREAASVMSLPARFPAYSPRRTAAHSRSSMASLRSPLWLARATGTMLRPIPAEGSSAR